MYVFYPPYFILLLSILHLHFIHTLTFIVGRHCSPLLAVVYLYVITLTWLRPRGTRSMQS